MIIELNDQFNDPRFRFFILKKKKTLVSLNRYIIYVYENSYKNIFIYETTNAFIYLCFISMYGGWYLNQYFRLTQTSL